MGFPVEAPEHRPGRVGHTPQVVDVAIHRSRLEGVFTSAVARAYSPQEYAMQEFRQPQTFGRARREATLLALEDARRRLNTLQPWQLEFREGLEPRFTRAPR